MGDNNNLDDDFFSFAEEWMEKHPEGPGDNPNGKGWGLKQSTSPRKEKEPMSNSQVPNSLDSAIESIAASYPPSVKRAFLAEYRSSMPFIVKDAINAYYAALGGLKDKESIDDLKSALDRLKEVCEANPSYQPLYESAAKEAKEKVTNAVASEDITLLDI